MRVVNYVALKKFLYCGFSQYSGLLLKCFKGGDYILGGCFHGFVSLCPSGKAGRSGLAIIF